MLFKLAQDYNVEKTKMEAGGEIVKLCSQPAVDLSRQQQWIGGR
jgi:hypothetical protein